MRIKRNLFISLLVFLCGILTTAVGISFAWLSGATTEVNVEPLTGGVISQYFHCGDGSENDPFVITKPVHLYNLTELYTLEDTFADEGYYFQLGYDLENNGTLEFYEYDNDGKIVEDSYTNVLDMNYYENFRPIGSESNPFNGTFEGSNLTVNNLNISGEGVSDIGFFGYVSDSAKVQNLYIDNITINTSEVEQNHHDHSNSYVGYIAGHIDNATCFENTYVNNCEIVGENDYIQNDWGYFGCCEDAATLEQFVQRATEGEGQGDEWGGSIDMLELNKRIYYFLNKSLERKALTNIEYNAAKLTTSRYHRYFADNVNNKKTFAISVYEAGQGSNASPWYNADPTNSPSNRYPLIYRLEGNANNLRDGSSGTGSVQVPGTYLPLLTDTQENGYTVLENNTGYIASSGTYTKTTVRAAAYKNNFIGNSMSPFTTAENTNFDVTKLEVLSNSTVNYAAGNYARIDNGIASEGATIQTTYSASIDPDDLSGYSKAYNSIKTILGESNYVQGLHFTGSEINKNNTVTIPTAYINGEEKTNYPVLTSSVDFHAKKNGSIKFFAGSYYNPVGTNSDSFFSLHAVVRNGNTISNTYQIYDIYENTNANTKKDYPNLYYDQNGNLIEIGYTSATVTRGNKLFDLRFLHNAPPLVNAAYYFEIPVNSGEFALGSVTNKTKGAYLMYLDIGTNGSQWEDVGVDDFTSIEYRSNSDTVDHSILLLTYEYTSNVELTIGVVYDDKKYYITASSNTSLRLQVTILNITDGYQYYVNNVEIQNPEIKTYEYQV